MSHIIICHNPPGFIVKSGTKRKTATHRMSPFGIGVDIVFLIKTVTHLREEKRRISNAHLIPISPFFLSRKVHCTLKAEKNKKNSMFHGINQKKGIDR